MRTKKVIAMLTALALMGALVACGKETDDGSVADKSSEMESSQEESSEEESSEEESSEEESSEDDTPAEPPTRDVGEIAPNAITFEDGNLYTCHQMGGGGDEADVEVSVVDLDGDKKVRIHALRDNPDDDYGVVKIVFDLPKLIGVENTGNIGHISVDFTCIANETWKNDDGSESLVVGNFLGALAGNIASEVGKDEDGNTIQNTWANHMEFTFDDWENSEHTWRAETDIPALLPTNGYAANDEGTSFVIMRWGQKNDVDFYIDNLTFYDKDGNSMEIVYDPSADEGTVSDEETPDDQNEADEPEETPHEAEAVDEDGTEE